MKGARILALAAAAVIAVNASANAAGRVWFEAGAASPNGTVLSQPGSPVLELQCDISQGLRCDWVITVLYENFDGGAFSWGLDVGTTSPEDDGKFTIKNIALNTSSALVAGGTTLGGINQPGGLLINAAGGGNTAATGAPAGLYQLMTFTLSKNKLPGELNTSLIYAGIQVPEFGGNDAEGFGAYEVIQVGPNAPVAGYNPSPFYWPGIALPGAVIVVRNVPEPATLGLIGLGALALIRRRK